MASSRKRNSKEKRNQQSATESDDNRRNKKKSKGGCYRRKSHKRRTEDLENKPMATTTNHVGFDNPSSSTTHYLGERGQMNDGGRSYRYDATDGSGRRTDFNGGFQPVNDTFNHEKRQTDFDAIDHSEGERSAKGGYKSDANRNNTSYRNQNRSSYSYEQNATAPEFYEDKNTLKTGGRHNGYVEEEFHETRVVRKKGKHDADENDGVVTVQNGEQFRRKKRASVVSKVSSSFSSSSSFGRKHVRNQRSQGEKSYSSSVEKNNIKKVETVVSIQRSVGAVDVAQSSQMTKKTAPVLKANKSYNISFAMTEKGLVQHGSTVSRSEIRSIEAHDTKNKGELKRKKSSKRIQTEDAYLKRTSRKDSEDFSSLMKDVDYVDGQRSRVKERVKNVSAKDEEKKALGFYDETDRGNGISSGSYGRNNSSSYVGNRSSEAGNNRSEMASEWRSANNKNGDIGDAVYTSESVTFKEWMLIEHPDGKQEKREYRRELNDEGDTSFVDILNGNVLKIEKADWKSGQELVKKKKGTEIIGYEWRKDLSTNEWVKYNAATNEIMRRGDWKTGSEWYRNSKGKLVERNFTYVRNSEGRWVKSDPRSGMVIDYSGCSALKGSYWVPVKKSGKTRNRKWRKQDYEYVQTSKGLWQKQDPVTKKKLRKPSKKGWKEGVDYHMDKDGRVRKVHYVWQSESSGLMTKVNKKTKEPVNTMWMRGREVIMQDNKVVTNNFCWVRNGKNKWVKIDEDTGKPLTNNIKSDKIGNYNQSESQNKTYVTKTSKRTDNSKIIEENTKIERNGGGIVKNTTTTIKY